MPQPISKKAPKGSKWVTLAGKTSPGVKRERYSVLQRSWAFLLEQITVGFPRASKSIRSTQKATCFPVRAMRAISRKRPSRMPNAPSSLGMIPRMPKRSKIRSWEALQETATASKISFAAAACCNHLISDKKRLFCSVFHFFPSGKKQAGIFWCGHTLPALPPFRFRRCGVFCSIFMRRKEKRCPRKTGSCPILSEKR